MQTAHPKSLGRTARAVEKLIQVIDPKDDAVAELEKAVEEMN